LYLETYFGSFSVLQKSTEIQANNCCILAGFDNTFSSDRFRQPYGVDLYILVNSDPDIFLLLIALLPEQLPRVGTVKLILCYSLFSDEIGNSRATVSHLTRFFHYRLKLLHAFQSKLSRIARA